MQSIGVIRISLCRQAFASSSDSILPPRKLPFERQLHICAALGSQDMAIWFNNCAGDMNMGHAIIAYFCGHAGLEVGDRNDN